MSGSHAATSINVHVEADVSFEVVDIWPDGDAPDLVTAEDVRGVMEAFAPKERTLVEWCVINDTDVTVFVDRPNPHWTDTPALFPEHAPDRWVRSRAEVWPITARAR